MKKALLSVLVCVISVFNTLAVPAYPNLTKKVQPDGTEVSVFLKGDEFVHWMESPDGYTLLYDDNGYIVYACLDNKGDLAPSDIKFGMSAFRASQLETIPKGLRYSRHQIDDLMKPWDEAEQASAGFRTSSSATDAIGSKKALCILIDFPDNQFTFAKSDFDAMMNEEGYSLNGSKGSVKDFFKENSYGKLDLNVVVVGPFRMAKNYEEYMSGSAPGHRYMKRDLVVELLNAADNSGIDFREFADNNRLETFHIIFAGQGDETVGDGKRIWSHKSSISTYTIDGVSISTYSCSPELYRSNQITNIGVICHELTHVFGAPDYYDTDAETGGDFDGTGKWDLMAQGNWNSNGTSPAHINMFQKIIFGWVNPVVLTEETLVTGMLNSAENPVAYTISANDTDQEKYVLENRQLVKFDSALPGHGLLIWHVHNSAAGGRGNNKAHPQQLYPVSASSTIAVPTQDPSSYGVIDSGGTPFPGTSGNRNFTDNTTPQAFSWLNMQGIGKPITNITETNSTISFRFKDSSTLPVTEVKAEVNGGSVTVSWKAPSSEEITGYKVFRNDILVQQFSGTNVSSFSQFNVPNGHYRFCVSVIYGVLESDKICTEVDVTEGSDISCPSVSDVYANASPYKVKLGWKAPSSGGWMGIAGDPYSAYSFDGITSIFAGVLWTADELKYYDNYKLDSVKFMPYDPGATYSIEVYNDRKPIRELIYSQDINTADLTTGAHINTITLNEPVTINASNGIIVGIRIKNPTSYCIVVDESSDFNPKNVLYAEYEWATFADVEISQNFWLYAYFGGSAAEKINYKIYRDNEYIGASDSLSFIDINASQQTDYYYCVVAETESGCQSEPVCATISTPALLPANSVQNLAVSEAGQNLKLTWSKPPLHSQENMTYFTTSSGRAYSLSQTDYKYAIRFTSEELRAVPGHALSAVVFYVPNVTSGTPITPENADYSLMVWKGGSTTEPGELILEQSVSTFANGSNTVTLSEPINIDVYTDLWVGISIHRKNLEGSMYTLSYSAEPNVENKGDLLYYNNKWTTGKSVLSSFDANWRLQANFKPVQATEFEIRRDGEYLASVANSADQGDPLSYDDIEPSAGNHTYCITAIYPANASLPECVSATITSMPFVEGDKGKVSIYAENKIVYIETDASNPLGELTVYNLQGLAIYSVKNINSSKYSLKLDIKTPEVCIIRAVTKNGVASGKIILN
ncbi:MAG: M6 family metalloprotease domain-containing protein [Dysgonamonadaceae bacterium]|jgi:M6 family metalloprotease-like protein|nr:M6 family metalloprotease domain-containing protein [Dysgonamonadaceae bacterium]